MISFGEILEPSDSVQELIQGPGMSSSRSHPEGLRMRATARREPRLRMGHLMIWVFGCAVGFAAYQSVTPRRSPALSSLILVSGYSLAMGTAFGTILTG